MASQNLSIPYQDIDERLSNIGTPADSPSESGSLHAKVKAMQNEHAEYNADLIVALNVGSSVSDAFTVNGEYRLPVSGDTLESATKSGIFISASAVDTKGTFVYQIGTDIVTVVFNKQTKLVTSVNVSAIGSPDDAADVDGSIYARIAKNKARIETNSFDIIESKLKNGSTIILDNFDGLVFNGEKIVNTASSFNGVVLPYIPQINISFSEQIAYICLCDEYPRHDLTPTHSFYAKYLFDTGYYQNVKYIHLTLKTGSLITAKSGEESVLEDIINVTTNYPLDEGSYYTLESAINAVPSNKRIIGQQIKYYDGSIWQIHEFTSKDIANYKYTYNWKKIEPYSGIKGVLFTPDSDIDFGVGIYCPILDIFVKENGGYDKLFFYACYKNSTRLYIAVCDENDKVVSSYINTSDPLSEVGIKTISLTQQDGSGVYIDIVVNLDNISDVSRVLRGKPEIIQKKYSPITIENFVDKDGKVFSEKVDNEIFALSSEISEYAKIEDVNVMESNRFTYKIPAYKEGTIVKVDKISGELSNYNIYKAKGEELSELTLLQKANFGIQYEIVLEDDFDYIYIFNATNVTEPFVCKISYGNVRALANRITSIEQKQGILYGKNIVCFGDSITEFKSTDDNKSYTDYLADILGANITNGGIGGTRLAQRTNPTDNPDSVSRGYAAMDICNVVKAWTSGDWSIVDKGNTYIKENENDDNTAQINRLKSVSVLDTDIVTIFGGTNDFTGGSYVGDISSSSLNEVNGALNEMFKMILTANPKIRIYVFCPIVRYFGDRTDDKWSDNTVSNTAGMTGKKLPDLCDIIAENCKVNHIPVNNWYWTLGWNKSNFSAYFLDTDSTHPYKGFKYLAEKMAGFLIANY